MPCYLINHPLKSFTSLSHNGAVWFSSGRFTEVEMTSIDMTHALHGRDAASAGRVASFDMSRVELSQSDIDRAVRTGRRLRSQAFANAASLVGAWLLSTARSALGRRATNKLGCGECGDMMRA